MSPLPYFLIHKFVSRGGFQTGKWGCGTGFEFWSFPVLSLDLHTWTTGQPFFVLK